MSIFKYGDKESVPKKETHEDNVAPNEGDDGKNASDKNASSKPGNPKQGGVSGQDSSVESSSTVSRGAPKR